MTIPVYPLEKVLEIKKKRVEDQEKVVEKKKKELAAEEEKLKKCQKERDKVVRHRQDKLNQLRDELDQGTTAPKIQQMKIYIKVVDERIVVEEKKVEIQEEEAHKAEKNLEIALDELNLKRREVDKLTIHRKDWTKQMKKELEIAEEKEMDEIGQIIYTLHQRRGY